MKLCRYDDNRLGIVDGGDVFDVTGALDILPDLRWPLPLGDPLIANLDAVRRRARELLESASRRRLGDVRLLSPVANPSKIIGAPVNYQKHLAESKADANINFGSEIKGIDHYGLFLKANSALVGPGEGIDLRFTDRRNDHEAELVAVIGLGGSNIPRARAFDHIVGYTMGLDMTVRGTEDRSFRKSIDSYAVVGPWLVTADEIADPDDVAFELKVNGEVRQQSSTRYLIFDIAKLVEYASSFYTLYPGDLIMTGTPEGVGPVRPGDVIDLSMSGIGDMRVAVREA
jgi:2,4-diketo-3-deoxy-L-fuconate hydrolase